jgi:hypothetical protein
VIAVPKADSTAEFERTDHQSLLTVRFAIDDIDVAVRGVGSVEHPADEARELEGEVAMRAVGGEPDDVAGAHIGLFAERADSDVAAYADQRFFGPGQVRVGLLIGAPWAG